MIMLDEEEQRAIFLGRYTTRTCGYCNGTGMEWVDQQEGDAIGHIAPPKELQDQYPERFTREVCAICNGVGGSIEFLSLE